VFPFAFNSFAKPGACQILALAVQNLECRYSPETGSSSLCSVTKAEVELDIIVKTVV